MLKNEKKNILTSRLYRGQYKLEFFKQTSVLFTLDDRVLFFPLLSVPSGVSSEINVNKYDWGISFYLSSRFCIIDQK